MYGNERACGRAIQNIVSHRSQVFFTTKIPPESMGYERTKRAIDTSLEEAEQEYFDLYVGRMLATPHWNPSPPRCRCVVPC